MCMIQHICVRTNIHFSKFMCSVCLLNVFFTEFNNSNQRIKQKGQTDRDREKEGKKSHLHRLEVEFYNFTSVSRALLVHGMEAKVQKFTLQRRYTRLGITFSLVKIYLDRKKEREKEGERGGRNMIEQQEEIKNTSHMLVYNNNTNTQYTLYKPIGLKRTLSYSSTQLNSTAEH